MITDARLAVSFLTSVPAYPHETDPERLGRAVPWFPVVGALIGIAVGTVVWVFGSFAPPLVSAALGVGAGMLLTRGFHEDGLADSADGLGGGWTVEDRLRIMKDSRIGTYGGLALIMSVVLRVVLIAAVPRADVIVVLIATHALARSGAVAMLVLAPKAKQGGLGVDYLRGVSRTSVVVGIGAGVAVGWVCLGTWSLVSVLAVAATTLAVGWLAYRKIGGVTGDVAGAAEQLGEIAVLVSVV